MADWLRHLAQRRRVKTQLAPHHKDMDNRMCLKSQDHMLWQQRCFGSGQTSHRRNLNVQVPELP